jgi:adenylate cyclase
MKTTAKTSSGCGKDDAEMKRIYETSYALLSDMVNLSRNLMTHNPGLSEKGKVPLGVIQQDIAYLVKELYALYSAIGGKIKNGN